MQIVHFIHRYPPARGGAEAYCERLTHYLQHHGHDVAIFTSTANDLSAMWNTGYAELASSENVQRFKPLRFWGRRYLFKALSLIPHPPWQAFWLPCNPVSWAMWQAVEEFAPEIHAVHAFAFPYSFLSLCAWKLARRKNVPLFLTPFLHLGDPDNPHNKTRQQYTSRPLRWLLKQANRVFVQTPSEFQAVQDLGVMPDNITLQGLGVDVDAVTRGDRHKFRTAFNITDDECVIGHLANASYEKGTIDLLQACNGMCKVVLAGPEMPNFQQFWQTYPHKDHVIRLGELTDSQKQHFFAGIDVFVLPSRSDSFGLVLLEAWANGVPCVVYRAGGPADLVRDGVDGRVVPCGDVEQLRQALQQLANNLTFRKELGEAGQARMPEFRWPDKLQLVLNQLELATKREPFTSTP